MTEKLRRTMTADLEIRSSERTIFGLAVPFDSPTTVDDGRGPYDEVFRRGAFTRTIAERGDRVKLLVAHDRQQRLPIGRATLLREDRAGLYGEFRVSRTREGDEVLELVRDGALDAFSVGFRGIRSKPDQPRHGEVLERLEVALAEVSVVPFPAYAGAAIAGVRSRTEDHRLAVWRRRLTLLEADR